MDLTESYKQVLPPDMLERYEVREVRNAAALFQATNPTEFSDMVLVLGEFALSDEDVLDPGGNKSKIAARLDLHLRKLGWREARHDTQISSVLKKMPYRTAGETEVTIAKSEVRNEGYKVDTVKGRVALDVEWNAKDGNLDRYIGAYRALYEAAIIDVGVIVTRTQADLRAAAKKLDAKSRKFNTTTTNLMKLEPRLGRGDAGGCPVLAIAITARCIRPRR